MMHLLVRHRYRQRPARHGHARRGDAFQSFPPKDYTTTSLLGTVCWWRRISDLLHLLCHTVIICRLRHPPLSAGDTNNGKTCPHLVAGWL